MIADVLGLLAAPALVFTVAGLVLLAVRWDAYRDTRRPRRRGGRHRRLLVAR